MSAGCPWRSLTIWRMSSFIRFTEVNSGRGRSGPVAVPLSNVVAVFRDYVCFSEGVGKYSDQTMDFSDGIEAIRQQAPQEFLAVTEVNRGRGRSGPVLLRVSNILEISDGEVSLARPIFGNPRKQWSDSQIGVEETRDTLVARMEANQSQKTL